jgi:hypothetical protein
MLIWGFAYTNVLYGLPLIARGWRSLLVIAILAGGPIVWLSGQHFACVISPICDPNDRFGLGMMLAVTTPFLFGLGIFVRLITFNRRIGRRLRLLIIFGVFALLNCLIIYTGVIEPAWRNRAASAECNDLQFPANIGGNVIWLDSSPVYEVKMLTPKGKYRTTTYDFFYNEDFREFCADSAQATARDSIYQITFDIGDLKFPIHLNRARFRSRYVGLCEGKPSSHWAYPICQKAGMKNDETALRSFSITDMTKRYIDYRSVFESTYDKLERLQRYLTDKGQEFDESTYANYRIVTWINSSKWRKYFLIEQDFRHLNGTPRAVECTGRDRSKSFVCEAHYRLNDHIAISYQYGFKDIFDKTPATDTVAALATRIDFMDREILNLIDRLKRPPAPSSTNTSWE